MKPFTGLARPVSLRGREASSAPDETAAPFSAERNAEDELRRIDSALRRLDTGRFGHCLYCGDPISVKRLDHDPAIDSCAMCDEG